MKIWRWVLVITALAIIGLAVVYFFVLSDEEPTVDLGEAGTPQMAAMQDLLDKSETLPEYYYQNGFPRYVGVHVEGVGGRPVEMALNFLDTYKDLYFQTDPDLELSVRQTSTIDGMDIVKLYQTYRGIEVLGGEIVVYLNDGQVTGTVGPLLPTPIVVDTIPVFNYREAEQIARESQGKPDQEILGQTTLMLYDPSLFGRVDSALSLVWRVTISGYPTTRVYVDAHTGEVALTHRLGEGKYSLDLRDAEGKNSESTGCYWNSEEIEIAVEGNFFNEDYANGQVPDAENAYWYAADIYSYFVVNHNWESYDNDGGQIEVYINASLDGALAAWTPGFLDCDLIEFETGCVTLDVFTHEFTHGIVEYTSQIIATGESAALEESLADIMGIVVDADDWMMAEDSNPATCPGHNMDTFAGTSITHISQYDESLGEYHNLKIHDHVVYMIGTGGEGAWHGGLNKSEIGQLYFYVLTTLGSSAGFADARGAAIQYAASNLGEHAVCLIANAYGTAGIGAMSSDTDCDGFEDDTSWDSDMVPFDDDNCPYGYNPDQLDTDGDGMGDACDDDDDADFVLDVNDNCPLTPNSSQDDSNNDGIGDRCQDSDFDGILDWEDNCISAPNFHQVDQDGDGVGDACDEDLDGDGVNEKDANGDPLDNCPFIYNPDQANADDDWIGDACDLCPADADSEIGQAYEQTPTIPGTDFTPQPYQQDSDGDGIPDLCDVDDGARYSAPQFQPQPEGIDLKLIGNPGSFLQIPLVPCAPDEDGAYPVNTHAMLSLSSVPDGIKFTFGDDTGMPAGKLMMRDGLPVINFSPLGGRSYFLGVLFSPDIQPGNSSELEIVYTCNHPDESGEPDEPAESEPIPTPTLTPTSPPEISRCDLFDQNAMSVVLLDLPSDASHVRLYVHNPDGFPNFDFDVPEDNDEWRYHASLGGVEENYCRHEGYFGRIYCDFALDESMWNTYQELNLYVNLCGPPIYNHQRISIIIPEGFFCSSDLDRSSCQEAGGTFECGLDCRCVCP